MVGRNDGIDSVPRTRRNMLARAAGISAAAGLGLAGANRVLAQDATPTLPFGGAGAAVDFKNVEGVVIAKVGVSKVTDPFSGYNPANPPPRGNRYILISVTVENTGSANFVFDPNTVFIQDVDNFVVYPTSVDLGPEPAEPALAYQEIPPATTVTGVIGYVLVQGIALTRVFYAPSRDRLVLLSEL